MSESTKGRSGFSMAEAEELPQYRRPSAAAIGGFFAGLASPLALIHPLLWVVPAIGVLVSIVGLRATRQVASQGETDLEPPMSGRLFAILGLALALLFAGWAPARHYSRQATLIRQSREFAEHFFETLQAQQLKELHQLSRAPADRRTPGVSLEDAYNITPEERGVSGQSEEGQLMSLNMDPLVLLDRYVAEYPLRELLAQAQKKNLVLAWRETSPEAASPQSKSRIVFDHLEKIERFDGGLDEVTFVFRWETTEGGKVRNRPLTLVVRRHQPFGGKIVTWQQSTLRAPQ